MGHTVQSIKEVIKLIKALKFARYTTRIIFTIATDRQRHEDQESSSPRAHRKCNDPGICVFLYLCLCSFLQWSRTRLWWRLGQNISWSRRRTRLRLTPTTLGTWTHHPSMMITHGSTAVMALTITPGTRSSAQCVAEYSMVEVSGVKLNLTNIIENFIQNVEIGRI